MSKHLVDIDPKLLQRARAVAGTETIRATVEAGLRRLADEQLVLRHIKRLRKPGALSRERLDEARASRVRLNG